MDVTEFGKFAKKFGVSRVWAEDGMIRFAGSHSPIFAVSNDRLQSNLLDSGLKLPFVVTGNFILPCPYIGLQWEDGERRARLMAKVDDMRADLIRNPRELGYNDGNLEGPIKRGLARMNEGVQGIKKQHHTVADVEFEEAREKVKERARLNKIIPQSEQFKQLVAFKWALKKQIDDSFSKLNLGSGHPEDDHCKSLPCNIDHKHAVGIATLHATYPTKAKPMDFGPTSMSSSQRAPKEQESAPAVSEGGIAFPQGSKFECVDTIQARDMWKSVQLRIEKQKTLGAADFEESGLSLDEARDAKSIENVLEIPIFREAAWEEALARIQQRKAAQAPSRAEALEVLAEVKAEFPIMRGGLWEKVLARIQERKTAKGLATTVAAAEELEDWVVVDDTTPKTSE
ncbi:hypothetical protein B0J14DRAFT_649228 [Halenospora varia]|nr:hypothetical protein B0J14DRAFT_649228 [Halenospora varia]